MFFEELHFLTSGLSSLLHSKRGSSYFTFPTAIHNSEEIVASTFIYIMKSTNKHELRIPEEDVIHLLVLQEQNQEFTVVSCKMGNYNWE